MSHEALLGLATTRELLAELMARVEVNDTADYRTVGDSVKSSADYTFPGGIMRIVLASEPSAQNDRFVEIENGNGQSRKVGTANQNADDGTYYIEIDMAHELNRREPLTVAHHSV